MSKGGIKSIAQFEEEIDSGNIDLSAILKSEIENISAYNPRLNAFIITFVEHSARAISRVADNTNARTFLPKKDFVNAENSKFSLFGVPLTIKDNIFLAEYKTTAASGAFQDFVPVVNAEVVDLFLSKGCIPLGKTNLHELAMGATSSSSFFGPVHNPVDPSRISGGSSGGSAVSVAMAKNPIVSLGTDTGGSVRVPAALCGVCGFKPTIGTISTSGIFPLSATLDHVGILTKSMNDMRYAFNCIVQDEFKTRKLSSGSKVRIGIPGNYFFEDCQPDVEGSFKAVIDKLAAFDFVIVNNLQILECEKIPRTRKTVQVKEAAWFYQDLVEDPEKRKLVANDVLSFFDAGAKIGMLEFMISSKERLSLIANISKAFDTVDYIAMPTCLTTAPKLDDIIGKEAGAIRRQLVRNTEPFNLCGFPSLTLPSNRLDSTSLPVGFEISGLPHSDFDLLDVGERIWEAVHGA